MRDLVTIATGGSSGIGREVAITLATLGARVLITARRQPGLDEVCAQSANIRGIIADVAKAADA